MLLPGPHLGLVLQGRSPCSLERSPRLTPWPSRFPAGRALSLSFLICKVGIGTGKLPLCPEHL